MNGVEILSEQVIYNTLVPEWVVIAAIIGMFVVWIIGFFFIAADKSCTIPMIIIVVLAGISICGAIDNKNSIDYIEYKATIDDSVSINELLDKYEILDQEGKIYIIKEKEHDENS